jgi:hypothetical protein
MTVPSIRKNPLEVSVADRTISLCPLLNPVATAIAIIGFAVKSAFAVE